MITETKTMNTRPHQDLRQAGGPVRVRMMPLGQTLRRAQGLKSLIQFTLRKSASPSRKQKLSPRKE